MPFPCFYMAKQMLKDEGIEILVTTLHGILPWLEIILYKPVSFSINKSDIVTSVSELERGYYKLFNIKRYLRHT
jgi:hypothetical protein